MQSNDKTTPCPKKCGCKTDWKPIKKCGICPPKKCICPPGPPGPRGPRGKRGRRAASRCECCVKPMQRALNFVRAAQTAPGSPSARVGTIDSTMGIFPSATILAVNDFIVKLRQGGTTFEVPIWTINGIEHPSLVNFVPKRPPDEPRGGECDCIERPIRERLLKLFRDRASFDVDVFGEGFNNLQNVTQIRRPGEGIALISRSGVPAAALSICYITSISDITTP